MAYHPKTYEKLDSETFDAVVTGELVHLSLHCEQELIGIIADHFCRAGVESDFRRLLLYRDGLGLQDKIEIVRAMLPMLQPAELVSDLKLALRKVEELKTLRNAFAHGLDGVGVSGDDLAIVVAIVGRSGIEKEITVTPTSHCQVMSDADELAKKLRSIAEKLRHEINSVIEPRGE